MSIVWNRRTFVTLWGTMVLAGVAASCASKSGDSVEKEAQSEPADPCIDFSNLSESDLQLRKGFGYVEETPIDESNCANCNLWKPPLEGRKCGGCTLFKGPVYDNAYCTYWVPVM